MRQLAQVWVRSSEGVGKHLSTSGGKGVKFVSSWSDEWVLLCYYCMSLFDVCSSLVFGSVLD